MTSLCALDVYSNATLNSGNIWEIMQKGEYVEVSWIIQNISERPGLQHQGRNQCLAGLAHRSVAWGMGLLKPGSLRGPERGRPGLLKALRWPGKVFGFAVNLNCNHSSLEVGRQQSGGPGRQRGWPSDFFLQFCGEMLTLLRGQSSGTDTGCLYTYKVVRDDRSVFTRSLFYEITLSSLEY